jgi:transposase
VEEVDEVDQVVARVAALDLAKASLVACVRVPADTPGKRCQEVRTYETFSRSLLELADWLRVERVTRVAMEATSDYWKPVFYLLEAEGFECWLVNPKHVKHLPGRSKTDKLDAVWLAKVVERGMCRPSLVHPTPIRQLRDLTRYRRSLIRDRTRERQRLEKLLEDAQIKLSSVISDILGVSGRAMLETMIAGNRNPRTLAQLARTNMRTKIPVLEEALTGHFTDHHAFLVRSMIDRIDAITTDIDRLDEAIEEAMAPFRHPAEQLDEVTGIGVRSAQELIGEIGVDMTRFPTCHHIVSWAKFAPILKQSATKTRNGSTGKGNPWLAATLGEIVASVARTHTFLGERYRRIARRRGKKRAIVAVGNSILKIVWHLLSDPEARYHDLGQDHYQSRHTTQRRRRTLIRDLEHLTGQRVTLQPHAA